MKLDYINWDDDLGLSSHFRCDNSIRPKQFTQRGKYYVLYNFIQAEKEFACTESITLSAPGDFRFLDNIIELVNYWKGPISVALYAPGDDFYTTLNAIAYLRNCADDLIVKLVTFHLIFDQEHTPKLKDGTFTLLDTYQDTYNCSVQPPWQTVKDADMYKSKNNLLYPINVARNVAKLAAKTYLVFPSDIELYPSKGFIPLFLKFVRNNLELFTEGTRNVFVLPIFEVLENQAVPRNKSELLSMLNNKTAFVFHQKVCQLCHKVIDGDQWIKAKETSGLDIFSVGKRHGKYGVWEPFFVCTQKEPLWDERMTWEGQNNKMVQAYTLCEMDYNFYVMDNAYLIHRPGVKKKKDQIKNHYSLVVHDFQLLKNITKEIQVIYGHNENCTVSAPAPTRPNNKPEVAGKNQAQKKEQVVKDNPKKEKV
ncbi:beta-1,4-glucuronyltransferase 1-like isoform X2 [Anthonomus grandis grandis]|nr:beta-1,4-glucuronyltransferase 1-like isoform X2 [Anthonomus grandis grandis]